MLNILKQLIHLVVLFRKLFDLLLDKKNQTKPPIVTRNLQSMVRIVVAWLIKINYFLSYQFACQICLSQGSQIAL
jgi:hypothetical protein